LYRKVWEDEKVQEKQITQETVRTVSDALGRAIMEMLAEEGSVKWIDNFSLKRVLVRGWKTKSFRDDKETNVDDFYRVYISPSKRYKERINKELRDTEK